jgi:hypothetical protein
MAKAPKKTPGNDDADEEGFGPTAVVHHKQHGLGTVLEVDQEGKRARVSFPGQKRSPAWFPFEELVVKTQASPAGRIGGYVCKGTGCTTTITKGEASPNLLFCEKCAVACVPTAKPGAWPRPTCGVRVDDGLVLNQKRRLCDQHRVHCHCQTSQTFRNECLCHEELDSHYQCQVFVSDAAAQLGRLLCRVCRVTCSTSSCSKPVSDLEAIDTSREHFCQDCRKLFCHCGLPVPEAWRSLGLTTCPEHTKAPPDLSPVAQATSAAPRTLPSRRRKTGVRTKRGETTRQDAIALVAEALRPDERGTASNFYEEGVDAWNRLAAEAVLAALGFPSAEFDKLKGELAEAQKQGKTHSGRGPDADHKPDAPLWEFSLGMVHRIDFVEWFGYEAGRGSISKRKAAAIAVLALALGHEQTRVVPEVVGELEGLSNSLGLSPGLVALSRAALRGRNFEAEKAQDELYGLLDPSMAPAPAKDVLAGTSVGDETPEAAEKPTGPIVITLSVNTKGHLLLDGKPLLLQSKGNKPPMRLKSKKPNRMATALLLVARGQPAKLSYRDCKDLDNALAAHVTGRAVTVTAKGADTKDRKALKPLSCNPRNTARSVEFDVSHVNHIQLKK